MEIISVMENIRSSGTLYFLDSKLNEIFEQLSYIRETERRLLNFESQTGK